MFVEILPPSVRRLIAAGEVVECPADAVKELVENALDAEASRVEVELFRGGKSLIRVSDDGKGIHPEDIEKVVLEGATSKIRSERDLNSIRSYGFRGEALHAVSSVSRFTLKSRHFSQKEGREIRVEGGKLFPAVKVGMRPGTVVEVRDLFYNVPARRKFLSREDVERRKAAETVKEFALVRPSVAFRLYSEGRESFYYPPASFVERAEAVFGVPFEEETLEEGEVSLRLLIARNQKRGKVHLFINERPVQNRNLKEYLRKLFGTKSVILLFAQLPPYAVDVNVHPKKREVKIRRERKFTELLRKLVKGEELFSLPEVLAQREASYGPTYEVLSQLEDTFVLVKDAEFLYFLDQHLVEERAIYERTGSEEKACRGAVKAGRKLSREEMEELVKLWRSLENPHVCPHGRPIYWRIPLREIYEKVGRR